MSMMISGDPPDELSERQALIYPGEQSLPLTAEGIDALRGAIDEDNHRTRLLCEGLLLTGLKPGTFAHMTEEWLEYVDDTLWVAVPGGKIECTVSPGRRGRARSGGGHPCRDCKQDRDGFWSLDGTLQPRRVPVPDSEVADFMKKYFDLYDRVCTPATVNHRLKEIGEKAGFENNLSGANLRMTFGKLLVEKGFEGDTIRQIMGYKDTHQGKNLTQRYFILSEEHSNPCYYCGAESARGEPCEQEVFFPDSNCGFHS